MPLPTLLPEIWLRISANLDRDSLISLSEVNIAFNRIATDESHFRRLGVSCETSTHAAQIYRRVQALHYDPSYSVKTEFRQPTRPFCLVHDTLLLLDMCNKAIIAFPSGFTFLLEDLIGDPGPEQAILELQRTYAVLPGGHVALMNCNQPTRMAVLDLTSGNVVRHGIPGKGALINRQILKKNLMPAGDNAECLIYQSDENALALFDWRNGRLVQEICVESTRLKYLLGECHATGSMSVVGIVSDISNGSVKEIRARGFDGMEMVLEDRNAKHVLMVLKSFDKKTYVLITADKEIDFEETEFFARREDMRGTKEWRGRLNMRTWPELKNNGRVIQAREDPFSQEVFVDKLRGKPMKESLWILLRECGRVEAIRNHGSRTPVWMRRGACAAFFVEPPLKDGEYCYLNIVESSTGRRGTKMLVMFPDTTYFEPTYVCLVADHFLIGLSRFGEFYAWHYDRFCGGGKGVYGCSGFDMNQFSARTRHVRNFHELDIEWASASDEEGS